MRVAVYIMLIKRIIQFKLKWLAKLILAKYKPEVIGITGSAGKTSAKEAIYAVLSPRFKVRRNIKNYNNEIGLPLSIIGAEAAGKNIFGWLLVFLKAAALILFYDKDYPEILVLEMGVDRPGDMPYLLGIVRPNVGVVTNLGHAHIEFFETVEKIDREKGELVKNLKPGGWAILNADDERVRQMEKLSRVRVLTFGLGEKADVRARELFFSFEKAEESKELSGLSFKLSYDGSVVPVMLPRVIGYPAVYAALAGAAVGIAYGLNLVEISQALDNFRPPRGRMNVIPGIKNTVIIDDTYNASPQPALLAISLLAEIPIGKGAKKYAVLGDMLELGHFSVEGHGQVGKAVAEKKIDYLIAVGEKARDIARAAEAGGMSLDRIYHFADADAAKRFVQERIHEGDLILVKGSQGARMEKVVKEIMAEPLKAGELLVRQDWLDA